MAKNLKLTIKNEQLAKALKLTTKKEEAPAESTSQTPQKGSPASSVVKKATDSGAAKKLEPQVIKKVEPQIIRRASEMTRIVPKAPEPAPVKEAPISVTPAAEEVVEEPKKALEVESVPIQKEEPIEVQPPVIEPPVVAEKIEKPVEVAPKQEHVATPPRPQKSLPLGPVFREPRQPYRPAPPIQPAPPSHERQERYKHVHTPLAGALSSPSEIDELAQQQQKAKERAEKERAASKKTTSTPTKFDVRDRQGLRSGDEEEGSSWRRRRPNKMKSRFDQKPEPVRPSQLKIRVPISVKDLAQEMKLKASQVIAKLFLEGMVITINDLLEDETTIELIGHAFGCAIEIDRSEERRVQITDQTILEEIQKTPESQLRQRPPVVTFMGHVDHGKTSLIDTIRKSNIAGGEAGAITQHIGAFRCQTSHGDITILDTPGHEAFTLLRERGTAITDIVVLVVAGDEGMKAQTDEALETALAAKVPIVVAINKSDKPEFDPETVYRQLADRNLLPEAWGGAVLTVNCSAKTGKGITELLETVGLQSEMLELKANPSSRARGTVIESELSKGMGCVATVLVQNGTLRLGDALVIDNVYGRVKTMHDEYGKILTEAPPSTPVKITGLSGLPVAGCEFIAVTNEKEARDLSEIRAAGHRTASMRLTRADRMDSLIKRESELGERKIVNIILRADMQGSLEAVRNSLEKIKSSKVELNIISAGIGEISESDVELASVSNAAIIGFHTAIESHAESLVAQRKTKVKMHDVIYHLVDDVKQLMLDSLDKVREEHYAGTAEVRAVFKASSLGNIAGCIVSDGSIRKDHLARLFRGKEQIWEGSIASLKRLKDDVREVSKGLECGILLNRFNEAQVGDEIRSFEVRYKLQSL